MGLVLWSENAVPPCGDFTHHHHSQTHPLHWSPLAQNPLYEPLLHHLTLLFHLPTGTPPFRGQDKAWEVLGSFFNETLLEQWEANKALAHEKRIPIPPKTRLGRYWDPFFMSQCLIGFPLLQESLIIMFGSLPST